MPMDLSPSATSATTLHGIYAGDADPQFWTAGMKCNTRISIDDMIERAIFGTRLHAKREYCQLSNAKNVKPQVNAECCWRKVRVSPSSC